MWLGCGSGAMQVQPSCGLGVAAGWLRCVAQVCLQMQLGDLLSHGHVGENALGSLGWYE